MSDPDQPGYTVGEIVDGIMGGVSGIAVGAAVFPGFLLTVPVIVLVVMPVMALGALLAVATLALVIATVPLLLGWRSARHAWRARPALRVPRLGHRAASGSDHRPRATAGA